MGYLKPRFFPPEEDAASQMFDSFVERPEKPGAKAPRHCHCPSTCKSRNVEWTSGVAWFRRLRLKKRPVLKRICPSRALVCRRVLMDSKKNRANWPPVIFPGRRKRSKMAGAAPRYFTLSSSRDTENSALGWRDEVLRECGEWRIGLRR